MNETEGSAQTEAQTIEQYNTNKRLGNVVTKCHTTRCCKTAEECTLLLLKIQLADACDIDKSKWNDAYGVEQ